MCNDAEAIGDIMDAMEARPINIVVDDTNDDSDERHRPKEAEPKPKALKRRLGDSAEEVGEIGSESTPKKPKRISMKKTSARDLLARCRQQRDSHQESF